MVGGINYGSGWRKDVVNQCLEFEDPSLPDLAPSLDLFNTGMSSGRDRVGREGGNDVADLLHRTAHRTDRMYTQQQVKMTLT